MTAHPLFVWGVAIAVALGLASGCAKFPERPAVDTVSDAGQDAEEDDRDGSDGAADAAEDVTDEDSDGPDVGQRDVPEDVDPQDVPEADIAQPDAVEDAPEDDVPDVEDTPDVVEEPDVVARPCPGDPDDAPPDPPQCFEEVAEQVGLRTPGSKDGGLLWAHLDGDDRLDAFVTTDALGSFLYLQLADGVFTDVTQTRFRGLGGVTNLRAVLAADLNHDGYVDLIRDSTERVEVFFNLGPDGDYVWGSDGGPSWSYVDLDVLQFNVEGLVLVDVNRDGILDIVSDAHHHGFDVFMNRQTFFQKTAGSNFGLDPGQDEEEGDFLTAGDFDGDGDVDIVGRKRFAPDIWRRGPDGFAADTSPNFSTSNVNKGGVVLCDFDDDGDLDLFYSDGGSELVQGGGVNRIYIYEAGQFRATDQPDIQGSDVDGVDCADVDNDGDLDLFVATRGDDELYINETEGELRFVRHDRGIHSRADSEGAVFADYDRDGDMDLLVNQDGGNALWRNSLGGRNYLIVEAHIPVGDGQSRSDVGASVWLEDDDGERLTGVRVVSAGKGHGSQGPPSVHFGLPWGPETGVRVRVRWAESRSLGPSVRVVPSHLGPYQTVRILRAE